MRNSVKIDYYSKYLKYKNKYLTLRDSMVNDNESIILKLFEENKKFVKIEEKTNQMFQDKKYALTYGELTPEGFKSILNKLKKMGFKEPLVLADLGSGMGKIPIMAVHYGDAKKAVGVELAKERHDTAVSMKSKLSQEYQDKLTFINGDLLKDIVLNEFNVIFISNLCFSAEVNDKIAEKLKELKLGAYVFCSKDINAPHLKFLENIKVKMTWTQNSDLKIYQRI